MSRVPVRKPSSVAATGVLIACCLTSCAPYPRGCRSPSHLRGAPDSGVDLPPEPALPLRLAIGWPRSPPTATARARPHSTLASTPPSTGRLGTVRRDERPLLRPRGHAPPRGAAGRPRAGRAAPPAPGRRVRRRRRGGRALTSPSRRRSSARRTGVARPRLRPRDRQRLPLPHQPLPDPDGDARRGLPVVGVASDAMVATFGADGPVTLAEPEPIAISHAVEGLLDDLVVRAARSRDGVKLTAERTWGGRRRCR